MRIEQISLEGFWSYAEPQTIDIGGLPLVVGVGENGAGKSALLVSAVIAAFYGRFPTKTIEESISDGSAKGTVTVVFTVGDKRYRVTRSHPRSGSATASLHIEGPDGWRALTEKGTREVTAEITTLLGMGYTTASMTWIAEQGEYGRFSSALPAARFKLLSSVFDLDEYAVKAKAAAVVLKAAETSIDRLDGRILELSDTMISDDAPIELTGLAALADAELTARRDLAVTEADRLTSALATLEATDPTRQAVEARRALELVRNTRLHTLDTAQGDAARANVLGKGARERAVTGRAEATARRSRAAAAAAERTRIARERAEAGRATATKALTLIAAAEAKLPELHAQSLSFRAEADSARVEANIHAAAVAAATAEQAALRAEYAGVQNLVAEAKARIETLSRTVVDTEHASCFSCGQHLSPTDAQALIDSQLGDIARHAERVARINTDGKAAKDRGTQAEQAGNALLTQARALDTQAHAVETEHAQMDVQVAAKAERLAALTAADSAVEGATLEETADIQVAVAEYDAAQAAVTAEEDTAVAQATADLGDANARILAAGTPTAEENGLAAGALTAEAVAVSAAEGLAAQRASLEGERFTVRAEAATLDQEAAHRAEITAARVAQEERMGGAVKDLAEARAHAAVSGALFKAYSPGGIPAMILGGVIDELNEAINVSLARLSHGELAVQLSTERETASGGTENKITVYVETLRGVRAYENLSGGQKFRVDLAIRTGLTQVIARGTGTPIDTLILDEGWGTLDEKGILATFDTLHRLSESTSVLTVSHIESVRDAFSARVEVSIDEGTSVAVVVTP